MKDLIKIVTISSKEGFRNLRSRGPIFCTSLNKKIFITNIFLRHISGNTVKKREIKEIILRLSSISLIERIASEGYLVETREDIIVEKRRHYNFTYKIGLIISRVEFFIILGEKSDGNIVLISTFSNILKK